MFSVISVCRSVCLSVHGGGGSNVTTTHDALDHSIQEPPLKPLNMGPHSTGTCLSGHGISLYRDPPTGTDQDWKPS